MCVSSQVISVLLFIHYIFRSYFMVFTFIYSFLFFPLRAAPVAYGGSQAGGRIGAVDAGLHHSHSNTRSETRLQPTPQLKATPDP